MGRTGKATRVLVSAVLLGVLLVAQLDRHDDWWPLGMLGQYAHPRDPDGEVVDTSLVAVDATGAEHVVPLRTSAAGITRVELELVLDDLAVDPSRLAGVAATVERTQGYEVHVFEVRQLVHTLRDGGRVGAPAERTVLRWVAP